MPFHDSTNLFPLERHDKQAMPAHVKDQLDALMLTASETRAQLDILRKTRGQREVGSVKVPAHLQAPEPVSDTGVEHRATVAAVLPAKE